MLVRFDTGLTLDEATAHLIYQRLQAWSASERWWCGAPHVMIEHAAASRLHGTLDATFDEEPIDLAMGNRDARKFFAFLASTGVDWQIAIEGPRSNAIVPDPDAVFAANPTRYGDQIAGATSRGLGASAHHRAWLLAAIELVEEAVLALPARTHGELRAGEWRWRSSRPVTPVHLADRASVELGFRAIGRSWGERDRTAATDQLRNVLATQQAHGSSALPVEQARSFADQWIGGLGDDARWLVNGNTTESWQPLGDATFETAVVCTRADRVSLIYIADED